VRTASAHHLSHERYLSEWSRDDREAESALAEWDADTCMHCGLHRSVWDEAMGGSRRRPALRPVWKQCIGCMWWAQAEQEGPFGNGQKPLPGWYLSWQPVSYE